MSHSPVPALALLGLAGLAAACAKMAPPPGGPEDREAPVVRSDSVVPPPGAAGVAPDTPVTIVFSEAMDRRSVMRALAVFPATDFRETSWRGETLRVAPDPGWAGERNTILRIDKSAKDRRGNVLENPFMMRFTTKAIADSGTLHGRVWAGREMTPTAALLVFALPADTAAYGVEPASLAEPGPDGAYRLEGLDTAKSWRVAALVDRDGDARGGGRDEAWTVGEPIPLATGSAEVGDFLVGSLDSLGRLRGEVGADSGRAAIVLARGSAADTAWTSAPLPGGGAFTIEVPTGSVYRVAAFLDLDGDGARSSEEPIVEFEEPLRLDLTSERAGLAFDLRGLGPPLPTRTPSGAPVPDSTAAVPAAGAVSDSTAAPDSATAPPDSGDTKAGREEGIRR